MLKHDTQRYKRQVTPRLQKGTRGVTIVQMLDVLHSPLKMERLRLRPWNAVTWFFFLNLAGLVLGEETGRCSLFGRQHIHSFDGVIYEFPGQCSYMLAGDCQHRTFSILGDFSNGRRKGVTLFLGEVFELKLSVHGILSQGSERLPLPYASSSVFVGFELGSVRLWSEEFGFSVRIDPMHNIQLTLTKNHGNQTCGLCGNYNMLPGDDYTAQEGFVTEDPYDFANSWSLNGASEPCKRVTLPSQTCNSTGDAARVLMSRCEAMRTSAAFLRCAHLVDAKAFISVCESDVCHCGDGEECMCQVLLEYARTCASHGLMLPDWHTQSQCTPKCPLGMQYNECSQACSTSCQSLNFPEVCREECVDGCTCAAGKVLDGNNCVDASQCSCQHTGKHYPPGSTISQNCNTCVCRHGSWECTNEGCPGDCVVSGQSHFKTFDDKFFTFSGLCQYLLAKDCQGGRFSVVIESVQCADDQDAVCTRSVTLKFHDLGNQTIRLKHGGVVSVDSMDVQLPLSSGPLRIRSTVLSSIRLNYEDDLQLDWDGRGRVILKLSPVYTGKTCGLCGNYNGNQGDDFLTAGGLVETRVEGFGNAWKMNADCDNVQKQSTDPCSVNPTRVRFAEESCSLLMSSKFEPCHHEVNPAPYMKNCRYDVCSCADGRECLCAAVSNYAAACAARGVLIHWRGPGNCELICPGDLVYEMCGSVCNQTCRSLSWPDSECRSVCEEGCFCPRGLYLTDSGECVPPDQCSCHYHGEIYQPNDMFADHYSICNCENGAMHCTSNELPQSVLSDLFFDEPPLSRERRSVSCPAPLQRLQCSSVTDLGIECARTCQNLDLDCVSQGCISGCVCPPGKVRHRRDCITPEQCPCFHNNHPYAPGQSIKIDCNTCVCGDRQWKCTDRVCDGVCRTVGESHYISFDGLKFAFPGPCQYILAQDYCNGLDGTFRVLVENTACGVIGQRCSKSITVFYMGGLLTMKNGEVKMIKPVTKETEVEIVRSGLYYVILLGKHISLTWDTGTHVILQINGQYKGRVCGLCGNFDSIQNNDLMSSSNQLEVDAADFGNSWNVLPGCASAVQVPSQCSTDMVKLVTVEQSCRVLSSAPFRECNSVVDPEPYWEICTHDTCSCGSVGDCACYCDAIAAYAYECAQKGVALEWRSNDLCPLSCEKLNKDAGLECEWRFNACGSACPVTCQHPERLNCPSMCLEGCHANCPPGQVLDEVLGRCVEPSQCQVCLHNGERISHGKQIILNHDDPHLCQICHCENNGLTCGPCPQSGLSTLAPITVFTTPTSLPFSTPVPEDACDRAMDLAFLVDGSSSLSEEDFELVKIFILKVVERFRMGSAHTRATVLLFHSGVKSYDMQVQKWIFKKMVRDMRYSGGDVAFMDEAFKYLSVYIYDKDKREHAGRVAILLTASANPRPMRTTQRLLRKKDITVLSIALGPEVNMAQVNDITKATPNSRAYVLSSVGELENKGLEIIDYLCTLGLDPELPKKPSTAKPTTTATTTTSSTTTIPSTNSIRPAAVTLPPTAAVLTAFPSILSPASTPFPSTVTVHDITFLIEGSDNVGEEGFNRTRDSLVDVLASLREEDGKHFRITVMQYSLTVTIEISRMELQHRELVLRRMRQIRWEGGAQVNTGHAVRSLYETITTVRPSHSTDQMVFLITQSPPTDVIQRPPSSTHTRVFPIGIGPSVQESDLQTLSFPNSPIMLKNPEQLTSLGPLLVNISKTVRRPVIPTLLPRPTLPPSVPCSKPMDVLFLLRASSAQQFEDMKTFMKAFIKSADIGRNGTQIAVVVYGEKPEQALSWRDEQQANSLIQHVDKLQSKTDSTPRLGAALRLAVQTSISSTSGGRTGVAKVVVMLVVDRSTDSVQEPANEALTAGVSVFPIGVGELYDRTELSMLAGPNTQDNIVELRSTDELLAMIMLDGSLTDKLCRAGPPGMCVDDTGRERKPGDTWLMEDGCHTLLCNPSGVVTMQSHRVNCEKMEPPVCRHNLKALKVNQTCGCTWACPCMCMGSSTSHVVSFAGVAVKLKGACSYSLLRLGGAELVLHTGTCKGSSNQICMKSLEVREGGTSVVLAGDMKVTVNGVVTAVPFRKEGIAVTQIGALLHQLRAERHGFTLTFTPHSNEFTITLDPTMTTRTTGICGSCSDDQALLVLPDGTVTANSDVYLRSWAVGECVLAEEVPVCEAGVAEGCYLLSSTVFARCHDLVPPQYYVEMCQQVACHPAVVCDLLTAYSSMCRQQGVCVEWRTSNLCPMSCPSTMEYAACRTGCMEQCHGARSLLGDVDWSSDVQHNTSQCWTSPTEGCFCPHGTLLRDGECVSREACSQCVDQHGQAHQFMESWTPHDSPCMLCVCLDQQRINCTALPCTHAKAPVCGKCEILQEKMESKCCPEYDCVCDTANCKQPAPPQCGNGLISVLTNPGECAPVFQCVCNKEQCSATKPSCPAHKKLSVRTTECCDSFECVCDCHNSTQICPPGYITKEMTNDCGCVDITCLPDKVCVVNGVVYQMGSRWEEKCRTCTCTQQTDRVTGLHIAQCVDPVCNQICPFGTTYTHQEGQCCGQCRKTSCMEGDSKTGSHFREVGERWVSPDNHCVVSECVQVNGEVFIMHSNLSCHPMDTPSCPLGTELQCNTVFDCCPTCQCVPVDACLLNHTLIGVDESVLVDSCTHCKCVNERGKYHLSCRKMSCSPCSEGYILEPLPGACCGRCVPSACTIMRPDGKLISLRVNTTHEDGCVKHTCTANENEELVLETVVTTCPPMDQARCLERGGKISRIGESCCEMCTEPECRRMVGLLNYIRVDDCQSEEKLELSYCEGRCSSKSVYSLEKDIVESQCVCCAATGTLPLTVSLRCPNGTHTPHQVLTVTGCDCLSHTCPSD